MRMKKNVIKFLMLLVLIMIGVNCSPDSKVYAAANAVEICAVSYADESILVFNNGNSKIYIATETEASKGTWDVINVISGEPITVIDISWLSPNIENILIVKGDGDETQARVIINSRPQKLDVSINYSLMDSLGQHAIIGSLLNIMSTEGTGVDPITFDDLEWKKGEDGHWLSTQLLTKELLESYLLKGTYLYFRIAPVDDVADAELTVGSTPVDISNSAAMYAYTMPKSFAGIDADDITFTDFPDGTGGKRASSEVKLKVTKMSALPVTGIDGSEFTATIKYGKEYRVTTASGSAIGWIQVNDRLVKSLPLATMLNNGCDGLLSTTSFPQMLIEIRDYATAKAAASKITETNLNAQRILSGNIVLGTVPIAPTPTEKDDIYISYNGTKNMTVTIPLASVDNPYEFCVVKFGGAFDLARASWTTITKNTSVKVLSSKAVDFGTLYIRMKEVKYKAATNTSAATTYKLASTYKTFYINYPSAPVATKMTNIYTKGYGNVIKITVTLNATNKMPSETSLKYIKLGTKDVPVQSVTITPTPTTPGVFNPNLVYTMDIILDSNALETMTNCSARALGIYYTNNTVDKTSNKLTIKSPTAAPSLTVTPAVNTTTASGKTTVTVANPLGAGNSFVYTTGPEVTGKNVEDTITGATPFTNVMDIAIPVNDYLTIYEINTNPTGNLVRYKSIQITDVQ